MSGKKFRAWDTEAKCYIKDPILVDNFGNAYVACEESSNKKGTCLITGKPNVILEQYTGLKDKNGKEIYEGDILQIDDHILGDFEVLWHNLGWTIKRSVGFETLSVHKSEDIVIIGNIHENPELIGKEKE